MLLDKVHYFSVRFCQIERLNNKRFFETHLVDLDTVNIYIASILTLLGIYVFELHVVFLFNTYNPVAEVLKFEVNKVITLQLEETETLKGVDHAVVTTAVLELVLLGCSQGHHIHALV